MTFQARTRSECAALACCGVMVPGTSLKRPVQISWWNPLLISLGPCFRWSARCNADLAPSSLSAPANQAQTRYCLIKAQTPPKLIKELLSAGPQACLVLPATILDIPQLRSRADRLVCQNGLHDGRRTTAAT